MVGNIIVIKRVGWCFSNNPWVILAGTPCSMGPSQYHVPIIIIHDLENSVTIFLGSMTDTTVSNSILDGLVKCKLVAFEPNLVSLRFVIRIVDISRCDRFNEIRLGFIGRGRCKGRLHRLHRAIPSSAERLQSPSYTSLPLWIRRMDISKGGGNKIITGEWVVTSCYCNCSIRLLLRWEIWIMGGCHIADVWQGWWVLTCRVGSSVIEHGRSPPSIPKNWDRSGTEASLNGSCAGAWLTAAWMGNSVPKIGANL